MDEWIKAVYFDPDHGGTGQAGWWDQPNGSDTPLIPGLPGEGETTADLFTDDGAWFIPLGSYPDVQSPWGLLDVSGGAGMA